MHTVIDFRIQDMTKHDDRVLPDGSIRVDDHELLDLKMRLMQRELDASTQEAA
ncbi:hypothetical protein [Dyella jiangningensis]